MSGRTCTVADCGKPLLARSWCGMHYERWRSHGDPLYTQRPMWGAPAEERFWTKVDASGVCWQWMGGQKGDGYGAFEQVRAHRWAYEYLIGPIPKGLELDHLCRNRRCVNPDHLEPVTKVVNVLRSSALGAVNKRKTKCPQGHSYSGTNLIISRRGNGKEFRTCRACRDAHNQKRRVRT